MTTTKKELGITKGEWNIDEGMNDFKLSSSKRSICQTWSNLPIDRANAQLIAEAGTVANETGKTPRQLAEENKMLLEALKGLIKGINPEDACRGKYADMRPDDPEWKIRPYVGSKSHATDEQILISLEAIAKAEGRGE